MVRKRFEPPKTGIEWLKSVEYDKFFSKYGLGKKDFRFLKPMARGLMITYALGGACWWFNETSPLGWWTLKPMPKEEKELAHLYERKEYPYPGDKEAMDEFIASGGMIGTAVDPKGFVVFDRDGSSFQKEMQEQKFQGEASKLWIRMKNEVLTELHNKGFDVE